MWTSVSGLLAHGEKMNVIGNNISNVNTVGYKSQRMDFQDFVYQSIGTANGMGQVGRGTNIGIIMNDYSQGSLETTTSSTDIAIKGNGFFKVKPKNNNTNYYTRAGNFSFDKDGFLVDPHGYVLQGWAVDRDSANLSATNRQNTKGIVGSGSPVDIKLDTFTCAPRHTTNITTPLNLDNKSNKVTDDKCTDETDPFFAMLKNWDATQETPLGTSMRAHQSTMEVYDEAGRAHKLTIYFDRVVNNNGNQVIDGNSIGEDYWEFFVTMSPSEDVRDFSSEYDPMGNTATNPNVPEKLKGILGAGTLTFDSTGTMKDMSFFVPQTDPNVNGGAWWDADGNVDLNHFVAAPLSSNGYPMIAPNFSGTAGLQNAYGYDESGNMVANSPNVNAENRLISLDFGLRSTANSWHFVGDPNGNTPPTYIDSNGNDTGLPTAGGISGQVTRQVTNDAGKLIWTGSAGGVNYTAAGPVEPSGFWQANTSKPHNASAYHYTVGVTGGTLTSSASIDTKSGTVPTGTFGLATPQSNVKRDTYSYVDSGSNTYNLSVARDSNGAPVTIPSTGSWTLQGTTGGINTWVLDGNSGITVQIPDAALPASDAGATANNLINAVQAGSNWGTGTEQTDSADPVTYFWTAVVGGNTIRATSGSAGTVPTLQFTAAGHNATEFYFSDLQNPSVILTMASIDPNNLTTPTPPASGTQTWAAQMETVHASSKFFINGMDGMSELLDPKITSYEGGFYEHNGFKQDGYTYGDLRHVTVSTDGVLSAAYSNGVTLQLFQVTLHDFPSTQNLRREGGNLFTETRESGVPSQGAAGTGTFGETMGSNLEQSNADISREFVNMITTQRGFQANSKTITTVDTMLEVVISMKR